MNDLMQVIPVVLGVFLNSVNSQILKISISLYFSDYKMHYPPNWGGNGGASYIPNAGLHSH